MTFTVFLTIYERPEYLAQAIQSVLAQTYADWTMLAMDDGSTKHIEEIRSIIEMYDDPRIRPVWFKTTEEERRQSVRYATLINWAENNSDSEWITYLTHDDYYFPDRLQRMADKLEAGSDVVYGSQLLVDAEDAPTGYRRAAEPIKSAYGVVDHNSVAETRNAFITVDGWQTDCSWRTADGFHWNRLTNWGYVFDPVEDPDNPTDAHRFHPNTVDIKCQNGVDPWM